MEEQLKKLSKLRSLFFSLNIKTQTIHTPEIRNEFFEVFSIIDSLEKDIDPDLNCCPCKTK